MLDLEVTEKLALTVKRNQELELDLEQWKINISVEVNPNSSILVVASKPGNKVGARKTLSPELVLNYSNDEATMADELADLFIEMLVKPQIKQELISKLTPAIKNVSKFKS